MKRYLELLNEANKICFNDVQLKNIFSKYLPFNKMNYSFDERCEINSWSCACLIQENEIHRKLHSILHSIVFYDMYCGEFDDNIKRYYNYKVNMYFDEECSDYDLSCMISHMLNVSHNSYLVGGCIRDICIGKTPKDFDFVTDVSYEKLEEYFSLHDIQFKTTGKKFNVFNVILHEKQYEIALFRKDGTYSDGRRPDYVEIGDIFSDSERRDFSVNSLYFHLGRKKLLDPTGKGIDDVHNKTLRFNGKPEKRIKEDNLRVFRAYRFMLKGFNPESSTLSAIRSNFDEALLNTSPERIKNEIENMVGL